MLFCSSGIVLATSPDHSSIRQINRMSAPVLENTLKISNVRTLGLPINLESGQ
jgi:hypothetical protein